MAILYKKKQKTFFVMNFRNLNYSITNFVCLDKLLMCFFCKAFHSALNLLMCNSVRVQCNLINCKTYIFIYKWHISLRC